jgi:CRP/FNR family transcriptional regulator, cyclic AMP receptor protein
MRTILLIEDNDDIRNNTAEILELSNYKVLVAENGKVGVEKALANRPDLIICDIMMPVLDGYGVLHAIHKNEATRNTPFIFLTARSERNDYRKGMEAGADDYITKPFDGTELLNAVDGRLKKIDLLKKEFSPDLEGLQHLMGAHDSGNMLKAFTEGRNINKYKKKQVVYSEGNHPNRLYYVLKGKIKVYRGNEEGKELVTELCSAGDFLGYVPLIEGTVYHDTAQALEESELAVISKEDFDELLNTNKEIARKFIKMLAKNIAAKEEQLLGIAYNSLRKKVADAILMLQKKFNEKNEPGFVIDISRENLANIAGTAKESLIRTLGDFRNEKLVDILNDGSVVILNQKKLERLVN